MTDNLNTNDPKIPPLTCPAATSAYYIKAGTWLQAGCFKPAPDGEPPDVFRPYTDDIYTVIAVWRTASPDPETFEVISWITMRHNTLGYLRTVISGRYETNQQFLNEFYDSTAPQNVKRWSRIWMRTGFPSTQPYFYPLPEGISQKANSGRFYVSQELGESGADGADSADSADGSSGSGILDLDAFYDVTPRLYCNVYLHDRMYGGPEDGGTWFDTYSPEHEHSVHCRNDTEFRETWLMKQAWCDEENACRNSDVSSVRSEGRYELCREAWPAMRMPDSSHRYS